MALDIGQTIGGMLPSASTLMSIMTYIVIAIIVATIISVVVWWVLDKKKYNKIIRLHKKINGQVFHVGSYKATFEKLGHAGDYWCKVKYCGGKILPRPKIEYMSGVFNYYEREDGEWINFGIEDIDQKMKLAKVHYLEEDMRLHRVGIQKNLEHRLQNDGFWQKWGGVITMAVFVILITICLIVLFNKLVVVSDAIGKMADSVSKLADVVNMAQTNSGSGLVPVNSEGVQI